MKTRFLMAAAVGAAMALPSVANAVVIVLDFEDIAPHPNSNNVFIQDYYNGGTSSNGSSGTNFGIDFSDNSLLICLNTTTVSCSNTSRGGQGNPDSQLGALFFLSGSESIMNVAAGFDTGFSFFYSAINNAGSVSVFDGLDGTGNLLTTLALPTTTSGPCPGYGAGFCPFVPIGIAFAGIAKSVSFAGVANQFVIDDVTFGSEIPDPDPDPDPVPEPAALGLFGLGLLGVGLVRRRRG